MSAEGPQLCARCGGETLFLSKRGLCTMNPHSLEYSLFKALRVNTPTNFPREPGCDGKFQHWLMNESKHAQVLLDEWLEVGAP